MAWSVASVVDLTTMLVALLLAIVLVAGGGRRRVNLLLAGSMLLLAVNSHLTVFEAMGFLQDRAIMYSAQVWIIASGLALPFAYLAFLGAALRTPLTRPLSGRIAQGVLIGLAIAGVLFPFAFPRVAIAGPEIVVNGHAGWGVNPWLFAVDLVLPLSLAWALAAAIQNYLRSAPGTAARAAAKRYLLAFSLFDGSFFALAFVTIVWAYWYFLGGPPPPDSPTWFYVLTSATALVGLLLLTRALLRDQLVDFDLRLKWTVSRGTLAAVFVGTILIVVEFAQILVSNSFGVIAGALAAVVLFLAKRPLERFADRVADVAMPRVEDTDEYRSVRRREVYRAAVESALRDGVVTEKERDVLATLAHELGLDGDEARRIERDATVGADAT